MKNKKFKKTILALSLAAVVGIGGTLAYLSYTTDTATNTFTSSNEVGGKVEEIEWEETGKKDAEDYQPGDVIAKDPKITLEADTEPGWVAMSLDFIGSDETKLKYEDFQKYASHDGIKDGWVLIAKNKKGSELYAYKDIIAPTKTTDTSVGQPTSTPTIFDKITVNAGITAKTITSTTTKKKLTIVKDAAGNITGTNLEVTTEAPVANTTYYDQDDNIIGMANANGSLDLKLPKFEIAATGYIVQAANLKYEKAVDELIKLANEGKTDSNEVFDKNLV